MTVLQLLIQLRNKSKIFLHRCLDLSFRKRWVYKVLKIMHKYSSCSDLNTRWLTIKSCKINDALQKMRNDCQWSWSIDFITHVTHYQNKEQIGESQIYAEW